MKDPRLLEMHALLAKPGFFAFLRGLDRDEALDARDRASFDGAWTHDFTAVEAERGRISREDLRFLDGVREVAFKRAFRASNDAEIAARVADDIDLVAKSFLLHRDDSWSVWVLWSCYRNREFPRNP
jgi:hypothetical protein